MELSTILSILGILIVPAFAYLLNKKDAAQEEKINAHGDSIKLLFKKHDDDAAALVLLQRQIDKEHYIKPELDARFQSLDEVSGIYRTMYWNVAKCGVLPPPLDLYVFDMAVNSGPRRAVKTLQSLLGVGADGALGPVSIAALQEDVAAGRLPELCNNYLAARLDFFDEIVANDTTQEENINGWRNRIEHLRNA